MKLGVFTALLHSMPLEKALLYIKSMGAEMAEIGCGGYPGKGHCDPDILLNDDAALEEFKNTFERCGIQLSALSCHGNPVHPDREKAQRYDQDMRKAVLLAEKLGIDRIVGFSGCPGDSEYSKRPNWVVCPWPGDFLEILDYQWNEILIPYWKDFVAFARVHGVTKIALEPHPGFCVYNAETVLKLREAVGEEIGANLDPSHLLWQGADPVAVIRKLGPAIFHFHAKDTHIDKYNTAVNGVLDTKEYHEEAARSWIFRTVGYGTSLSLWKDIISELRLVGYDGAISIEHEDSLISGPEGLRKACTFLKDILIDEPPSEMFWV